jgi:hypothetical protein
MLVKRLVSDFGKEVTASIPVLDGSNKPVRARSGGKVFALSYVRQIRLEESPLMLFNGVSEGAVRKMRQLSVEHWRHNLLAVLGKINECTKQITANIVNDAFSSPRQLSIRTKVHRIVSCYLARLCQTHERGALERFSIEHSMPFTMDLEQLARLTAYEHKSLDTAQCNLLKRVKGSGKQHKPPASTRLAILSPDFEPEVRLIAVSYLYIQWCAVQSDANGWLIGQGCACLLHYCEYTLCGLDIPECCTKPITTSSGWSLLNYHERTVSLRARERFAAPPGYNDRLAVKQERHYGTTHCSSHTACVYQVDKSSARTTHILQIATYELKD